MAQQAKGLERDEEDRKRLEPASETQPNPAATGALARSEPTSTAGKFMALTAHHAISSEL